VTLNELGADISERDHKKVTLMHLTLQNIDHGYDAVKMLFELRADIYANDDEEWTVTSWIENVLQYVNRTDGADLHSDVEQGDSHKFVVAGWGAKVAAMT